MLFYKAEGMLANGIREEEDENRRTRRENARKLFMKSEEFNQRLQNDTYCFVAACCDGLMTIGMIADGNAIPDDLMIAYSKHIGCPLKDVTVVEITVSGIERLLSMANHMDYIEDDDDVLEKYGIDRITGRRGHGIDFGENLLEYRDRRSIFRDAEQFLMNRTLLPELERIYTDTPTVKAEGHPVHYMFFTDNLDTRRESTKLLMQALYDNDRLKSRRYCFLDFRPGETFSMMALNSLYNVCAGGTVVVRYLANDDSEDNEFASGERDTIERICEIAKRHRNRVLTIFCLPRVCQHSKALFLENLGTMTIVELLEDACDATRASDYLKRCAKERHIRTDKALFAKLDPEKEYLSSDLHDLFDAWYDAKLKTTVYPQYKELNAAKKEAVKAAPRGSAHDELQEMIGLTEAKAVIRKALNYYKMQKLYEENGVKADSPAMHMVFTGNPGTAKTTAARLFARIMKDNGLLSRGQLVEVGRGDLVGKYVGWTAQTVQEKFKAAKGGVLFIDEAYSLVEDRNGSFGDEAINTIVQEMENHREDVVVIFAGYPHEMETFLQKNPGLRSRIAFHIPFEDYTAEELCAIAQQMGKHKGIRFETAALEKLETLFESARQHSDFGNGRFVRNVLEQAKMNQASRLLEYEFERITADELQTIRAEDILLPEVKTETKRAIGFAG